MQFSVVIALYNKVDYIEQTLKSVLDQSFPDFEVLVVDDGSTDGGAALVENIQDRRVKVIRQKNAGVSAARNSGIANASGEWVAFLDADDVWHPEYLAVQFSTLSARPNLDLIATGFHANDDLSDWQAHWADVTAATNDVVLIEDLPRTWMERSTFFTSAIAIRASLLKGMQPCFHIGETQGEDLDLWFRLTESRAIAFCSKPLVGYRLSALNSLSNSHKLDKLPPYLDRMRKRALDGTLNTPRRASALRFVAQQKINFARNCLVAGQRRMALRWMREALPEGASIRRWWITLLMILIPRRLVRRFQAWRLGTSPA